MITVAMNAWPRYRERFNYFRTAVETFRKWATSPSGVTWLVAAESQGNEDDVVRDFIRYCEENHIRMVWQPGEPDLPSNQNLLFNSVQTKYAVYLQEDWQLNTPLDMLSDVAVMEHHGYDCVQYTWSFDPPEANVGNVFSVNGVTYHEIGTKQTWYYRDNPHIVNVQSLSKVGPFSERKGTLGCGSEYDFACRAKGKLKIAGRGDGVYNRYFSHIGHKSSMTEKWEEHRQRTQKQ